MPEYLTPTYGFAGTTATYTNTINWDRCYTDTIDIKDVNFLTSRDLDRICRKIYHIITEHVQLDISEDEFLNIINEE